MANFTDGKQWKMRLCWKCQFAWQKQETTVIEPEAAANRCNSRGSTIKANQALTSTASHLISSQLNSAIHSFIHPSFIHSFSHSFIHPSIHSLIQSSPHSFSHSLSQICHSSILKHIAMDHNTTNWTERVHKSTQGQSQQEQNSTAQHRHWFLHWFRTLICKPRNWWRAGQITCFPCQASSTFLQAEFRPLIRFKSISRSSWSTPSFHFHSQFTTSNLKSIQRLYGRVRWCHLIERDKSKSLGMSRL